MDSKEKEQKIEDINMKKEQENDNEVIKGANDNSLQNKKYKVLITYVEAGMGHIVSAEAIANALEKFYPDEIEVIRCKLFHKSGDKVLIKYENFLVNEVKKSNKNQFYLWMQIFFQHMLTPMGTLKLVHNSVFKKEKAKSIDIMKAYGADMIVSTHFAPLHFSIEAKRHVQPNLITMAYDPDPNVHAWWDNRADLFVVNNNKALEEAVKVRKFKKENVVSVPFILRQSVIDAKQDKMEYRKKYNLSENDFTVIIADGAYATAKLKIIANKLLTIDKKFTLIIVAGKNKNVYNYFSKKKETLKTPVNLVVCEFMKDIHELYCASDLFITKAGPNAILDSVYMGTPIITDFYSGPIELATKKLFVNEYGLGLHIADSLKMKKQVEKFISNPALLEKYTKNCKKFKEHGTGEKEIADTIYKKLTATLN